MGGIFNGSGGVAVLCTFGFLFFLVFHNLHFSNNALVVDETPYVDASRTVCWLVFYHTHTQIRTRLKKYHKYKCSIIILQFRWFNVPLLRFDLTVNEFTKELILGNELIVYDPLTWRPYCHTQDFAYLIENVISADVNKVGFLVDQSGEYSITANIDAFNNQAVGAYPGISDANISLVSNQRTGRASIKLDPQSILFDKQFRLNILIPEHY